MRLFPTVLALAGVGFALASPVVADEYQPELTGRLTAGRAVPIGATADHVQSGFAAGAGFDWRPHPGSSWVLQGDRSWNRLSAEQRLVDLAQSTTPDIQVDGGSVHAWGLTGGATNYLPLAPSVKGHPLGMKFYVLGAVGAYHRGVDMTETGSANPVPTHCDGFGYCYPGQRAPGDVVVYSTGTTKFGVNAGIGVESEMDTNQWWYIEARFHRIEMPHPTEYVPISIAVRF